MVKRIIGMGAIGLLFLYFITLILHISANHDQYMWDFRTHREAAKILASGADPNLCNTLKAARAWRWPGAVSLLKRFGARA